MYVMFLPDLTSTWAAFFTMLITASLAVPKTLLSAGFPSVACGCPSAITGSSYNALSSLSVASISPG